MTSLKATSENNFDRGSRGQWGHSKREIIPDRIYVGNLDNRVQEDELGDFFSSFGVVRHVGIISYQGYRGEFNNERNYGFVTFSKVEEAEALLASRDQLKLRGKVLQLGKARQRRDDAFKPYQYMRESEQRAVENSNEVPAKIEDVVQKDLDDSALETSPLPTSMENPSYVSPTTDNASFLSYTVAPPSYPNYNATPGVVTYNSSSPQFVGVMPDGSLCYMVPPAPTLTQVDPSHGFPNPSIAVQDSSFMPPHNNNAIEYFNYGCPSYPQQFVHPPAPVCPSYAPQYNTIQYYNYQPSSEQQPCAQQFIPNSTQDNSTVLQDSGYGFADNSQVEPVLNDASLSKPFSETRDQTSMNDTVPAKSAGECSESSSSGGNYSMIMTRQSSSRGRYEQFRGRNGYSDRGRNVYGDGKYKNGHRRPSVVPNNSRGRSSYADEKNNLVKDQPDLLKGPLEKLNLNN